MIWIAILLLAAVALTPLFLVLRRRGADRRGRREAAIALHRAQLAELDRDLADGRIAPSEHATAVLEVQRRLLAIAETPDKPSIPASRAPLVAALVLVPVLAFALYLVGGSPGMPSEPLAQRIARAQEAARDEAHLVDELRARLATIDPHSDKARQGYVLLGNVEASRRNWGAAAEAWNKALAVRFDPTLAVEAAEAATEAEGHISSASAALFRRALAEAPPDAPWRPMAEKRVKEADAAGAK
jgi:cytochrome c-type biogenesis protein CcmH